LTGTDGGVRLKITQGGIIIMKKFASYSYRLVLALWVGGVAIYTFLVTPAIFTGFGRDTAAKIVDSMMGAYFTYNLTLALVATALLFTQTGLMDTRALRVSIVLGIFSVIVCIFINFKLYPDIMAVKATVTSFETMPKDTGPRAEFGKLHAVSAVLNLSYLVIGMVMLYLSGLSGEKAACK